MTKVTRTAEEIIEALEKSDPLFFNDKAFSDSKAKLIAWLTSQEPTIEELRQARPWGKDIDVGEKVYRFKDVDDFPNIGHYEEYDFEFTESLSPLGLEFARVVQYLNEKRDPDTCHWYAYITSSLQIELDGEFRGYNVHRLHFCKDEATIRRAVQIFTEEKYRQMLGVK